MSNLIPIDFDSWLGYSYAPEMESNFGGVSTDPALVSRVQAAGNRLAPSTDNPKVPYTFKVLNTDQVNAFALPGGPVYVNKGLLNLINDDELAAVMGHELGHINARHSVESMELGYGLGIVSNIVTGYLKKSKGLDMDVKDIENIKQFSSAMSNFISLGYSRKNEYEADAKGLDYVVQAGYNPYSMLSLMKKFQSMQSREPNKFEIFFSTHPATSDRIDKIEGIIKSNYPNARAPALVPAPIVNGEKRLTLTDSQKKSVKYVLFGILGVGALTSAYYLYRWWKDRQLHKRISKATENHYKNPRNPDIPTFHSAEEARAYGHSIRNDAGKINDLRQARQSIIKEISKIQKTDDPDFERWNKLAAQSNFQREALETTQLKKNPIRPIKTPIPDQETVAGFIRHLYKEFNQIEPGFHKEPVFTIGTDQTLLYKSLVSEYKLSLGIFGPGEEMDKGAVEEFNLPIQEAAYVLSSILRTLKPGTKIQIAPDGSLKADGRLLFVPPAEEKKKIIPDEIKRAMALTGIKVRAISPRSYLSTKGYNFTVSKPDGSSEDLKTIDEVKTEIFDDLKKVTGEKKAREILYGVKEKPCIDRAGIKNEISRLLNTSYNIVDDKAIAKAKELFAQLPVDDSQHREWGRMIRKIEKDWKEVKAKGYKSLNEQVHAQFPEFKAVKLPSAHEPYYEKGYGDKYNAYVWHPRLKKYVAYKNITLEQAKKIVEKFKSGSNLLIKLEPKGYTPWKMTRDEFVNHSWTEIVPSTGHTKVIYSGGEMTTTLTGKKAKYDIYRELLSRAIKAGEDIPINVMDEYIYGIKKMSIGGTNIAHAEDENGNIIAFYMGGWLFYGSKVRVPEKYTVWLDKMAEDARSGKEAKPKIEVKEKPAGLVLKPIPKDLMKYAEAWESGVLTLSKSGKFWQLPGKRIPSAISTLFGTPTEWHQRVKRYLKVS